MSNRVFVVDDSPREGDETAKVVAAVGFDPVALTSGDACLDELAKGALPLAVLVRLELGGMRGDECCRRIKENQAWRAVGVVILTAGERPHEVMSCWRAAADDFLLLPPSAERLGPKLSMLAAAAKADQAAPRPLAGKSMLVAEPSRLYRNQIGANLEQAGMRVLYASEGEEALDVALENADALDACLLDTVLPGVDGATIAGRLRESRFGAKPIMLMSGAEAINPQAQEAARRLTGSGVLDKRTLPFEHLLSRVHDTLHPHLAQLRSSERTPFFSVVDFSEDGVAWSSGFTYDLSAGGLFIRTLTPAAAGAALRVRVRTAGERAAAESAGVVAWSNPYWPRSSFAAAVGMGVHLTRLAPFLASQVARLSRTRPQPARTERQS